MLAWKAVLNNLSHYKCATQNHNQITSTSSEMVMKEAKDIWITPSEVYHYDHVMPRIQMECVHSAGRFLGCFDRITSYLELLILDKDSHFSQSQGH